MAATFASYQQFPAPSNRTHTVWRIVGATLLIASGAMQISGVRTLRLHQQQVGEVQKTIANLPAQIIITNHYFFPSVMAPVQEKQFFYITTKEGVEKLAHRFAAEGIEQIAIIPGTYFIPEHVLLEIPDRAGDVIL